MFYVNSVLFDAVKVKQLEMVLKVLLLNHKKSHINGHELSCISDSDLWLVVNGEIAMVDSFTERKTWIG